MAGEQCSICLEPRRKGDATWVLKCGHAFHKACCQRWLSGAATCPLCKQPVERRRPAASESSGAANGDAQEAYT